MRLILARHPRTLVFCSVLFLAVPTGAFAQAGDTTASIAAEPQTLSAAQQTPEVGLEPSFVRTLGGDFRRLFSARNAPLTVVFGSAALTATRWDVRTIREVQEMPGTLFNGGNIAGGPWVQLGVAAVPALIGKVTHRPGLSDLGSELLRAQIVSQTLVHGMKLVSDRTRPDGSNSFSFPSGHAAGGFATATVLQRRFGWKAGVPAYVLGSYIATSRMAANRHYLSDVIIGAAVGISAGRAVSLGSRDHRFDLGVAPVPGGAAVTFTKRQ